MVKQQGRRGCEASSRPIIGWSYYLFRSALSVSPGQQVQNGCAAFGVMAVCHNTPAAC